MTRPAFLTRFLAVPRDRAALHVDGRWYSYAELVALGEGVAGWLREQHVGRGDRVIIQLSNGLPLVAAHLGCMALGAVRVPVNAHYRAGEVQPIVEDAAPTLILTEHPTLFPGLPCHHAPGLGAPVGDWPAPPEDITALLFTSGTTGRPKGVPQTYGMWASNLDVVATRWQLTADDRLHLVLPLFHTHGLVLGLHHTLLRGASARIGVGYTPDAPPADVTHVYGVPTYYHRWLPLMRAQPERFRRLHLLVSGSDGMDAGLSDTIFAATGQRVLERYGMTETVMITSNPGDGERRAGTVGTPLDGVSVRIVDGEIQVTGPSLFRGYRRYGPTFLEWRDGWTADDWFCTGDVGEWDDAGYLRIVGRKKDLVIVGGVNVSPAEVEAVLARVAGVVQVGVCGLPDDDLGEIVAAAVVSDGTIAAGALRAALDAAAHELSGLKRPRAWAFVAGLPRNALGKLMRGRIRAEVVFSR